MSATIDPQNQTQPGEQMLPKADKFKSILLSKSKTKQLREQDERRENKRKRLATAATATATETATAAEAKDKDKAEAEAIEDSSTNSQATQQQQQQSRVRASVFSSPEKIEEVLSNDILLQSKPPQDKSPTWCKLGKVAKIECLMRYAEKYAEEQQLDSNKEHKVKTRLLELLEKNQLDRSQTVVIYDRESRSIKGIQIPL